MNGTSTTPSHSKHTDSHSFNMRPDKGIMESCVQPIELYRRRQPEVDDGLGIFQDSKVKSMEVNSGRTNSDSG